MQMREVDQPDLQQSEECAVRDEHREGVAQPELGDMDREEAVHGQQADRERRDQDDGHVQAKREMLRQPAVQPLARVSATIRAEARAWSCRAGCRRDRCRSPARRTT